MFSSLFHTTDSEKLDGVMEASPILAHAVANLASGDGTIQIDSFVP